MSRNLYTELRRCALAGNMERAEKVLAAMLKEDAGNTWAQAESARLKAGEPLLSAQSRARYRAAVTDDICMRLRGVTESIPYTSLRRTPAEKLREQRGKIDRLQQALRELGASCPPEVRRYLRRLRRVLLSRWFRCHRTATASLAGLAVLVPVFIGGNLYMHHQAAAAESALESALANGQWHNVLTLRQSADSGIYRLLNPALKPLIYRTDAWMNGKRQLHERTVRLLAPLQRGERTVASLSLAERAAMERALAALPHGLDDLAPIWKQLCAKEQAELDRRKTEELMRLQAPLPPWPEWTDDIATDIMALRHVQKQTEERHEEFQDAVLVFHLEESIAAPVVERLEQIRVRLAGLERIRQCLEALAGATTYKEYAQALPEQEMPDWYGPCLALLQAKRLLPERKEVRNKMSNIGNPLPLAFVEEARHTFLETGPTFTQHNPATPRQVELMEDLFTSKALRTSLLEIRTPKGKTAYTADTPKKQGKDFISFSRHGLDPAYNVRKKETLTWSTAGLVRRTVDVSPLVEAIGLERRTFFVQANLPNALSQALNKEADDCPALARAYIYDRLLQVLMAHPDRDYIGVRFSPSLQDDSLSFLNVRDASGIELSPGCWLAPSEAMKRAEETFRRWFRQHRGHDYAKEIAKNYGELAQVHPRYIGYVGYDGKLRLHGETPQDTELWYVETDGNVQHDAKPADGKSWEKTLPFSPVFIIEKDS